MSYGELWETKLKDLWLDYGLSGIAIAQILGFPYDTVKRQPLKLGMEPRLKISNKTRQLMSKYKTSKIQDLKQAYRLTLEAIMKEYPEACKSSLMSIAGAVFTWLERNDSLWLETRLSIFRDNALILQEEYKFSAEELYRTIQPYRDRNAVRWSKYRLSTQQLQELLDAYDYPIDDGMRLHSLGVRLYGLGYPPRVVSSMTGKSLSTVRQWSVVFLRDGLDGLAKIRRRIATRTIV